MPAETPTTPTSERKEPFPSTHEPMHTLPQTPHSKNPINTTATTFTSSGEHLQPTTTLTSRPRLSSRKSSGTMIVPANHPNLELKEETFPPNDARAMSPRRSSADTDRMIGDSRAEIQNHAIELQSGLNALVERVESVQADHAKLERNNNALQDYIGGLTKSMSKTALDTGRKK